MITVASVDEAEYRQSRLCRLLGNPIAFTVLGLLAEGKKMNTSEIAKAAGRSVSRVSNILAALRLAHIVRYQSNRRNPGAIPAQTSARDTKNTRRAVRICEDHLPNTSLASLFRVFAIAKIRK